MPAEGQVMTKTVKILEPEKMCEHIKQLGELIHWQGSMNIGTGSLSVIPTLDKGRGKNRVQAVVYYCPLCGKPTFEEVEPLAAAQEEA
jgi:hypothetical protein